MRPNITITIPDPYITVSEYMKRTGLSENTVRNMIADGRLPVRGKNKELKQGTVFINLAALTVEALSTSNVSLQA
ncbi:helix-turn-helix transcriptional regulator [Providencia rettgeri]|uniref:helix-turn-helix transcriptional regulator n=1 Tax=Providencia TaxID=586 RepID=UPI001E0005BD|nr:MULTISPECIES: helix-turn-helix domain-containing protein [Providencia]EHZ6871901.1 helix-turn-helix domain-containing protein [Providencia rettgeri]EMC8779821.1 helix-turn-helix domain-containing protein [Providencia rettgeri]MCD2527350.1 helix-turn-helix domain-containing protein [Providencia huaxiensis]MCG5292495.1 helix-turn-helix domain-containing protein [Providencia rettgeri]MDM9281847.1 helix-turn-helix domain-containing protein [Providencia rettgeri]